MAVSCRMYLEEKAEEGHEFKLMAIYVPNLMYLNKIMKYLFDMGFYWN